MAAKDESERLVNFVRLTILTTKGLKILQQNFKTRYKEIVREDKEWQDGPQCGRKLKNVLQTRGAPSDDLKIIEKGRLAAWDIQKICAVLLIILNHHHGNPHNLSPQLAERETQKELEAIKDILHLRNRLAHINGGLVASREFFTLWRKGEASLILFGGDQEELQKIRNSDNIVTGIDFNETTLWDQKIMALGWVAIGKRHLEATNKSLPCPEKAAILFKMAITAGNAEAMFLLGKIYVTDVKKGRQNLTNAIQLFEKAATCPPFDEESGLKSFGVAEAMNAMGELCQKNPSYFHFRNYRKAADWYVKSIQIGDTSKGEAAYNLALLYREGLGVEMNEDEAIKYLKDAASRGNPSAMESLAWHSLRMKKVDEGESWLFRSIEAGNLGGRQKFLKYKMEAEKLKPKPSLVESPQPRRVSSGIIRQQDDVRIDRAHTSERRDGVVVVGGGSSSRQRDSHYSNMRRNDLNRQSLARQNDDPVFVIDSVNISEHSQRNRNNYNTRQSQRHLLLHSPSSENQTREADDCGCCSIM